MFFLYLLYFCLLVNAVNCSDCVLPIKRYVWDQSAWLLCCGAFQFTFNVCSCVRMSCMEVGDKKHGDILQMFCTTLIFQFLNAIFCVPLHIYSLIQLIKAVSRRKQENSMSSVPLASFLAPRTGYWGAGQVKPGWKKKRRHLCSHIQPTQVICVFYVFNTPLLIDTGKCFWQSNFLLAKQWNHLLNFLSGRITEIPLQQPHKYFWCFVLWDDTLWSACTHTHTVFLRCVTESERQPVRLRWLARHVFQVLARL